MAGEAIFPNGVIVQGNLQVTGSILPTIDRADLTIDQSAEHLIPWEQWRTWDAHATNLPGTAASDDLGLVNGTWATSTPSIQAGDLKAAGSTTRRAGVVFCIPPWFVTAGTFKIRAYAGMKTTVADTSCTIDFEAYRSDKADSLGSDLVTTAATSINSTSKANKDFTVDSTTLLAGDYLHIRMSITCNDAATVTAVIPFVGAVSILMDIRG